MVLRDELGMPLPTVIGSRQDKFTAAPELLERGEWVCLNISPSSSWPTKPQAVEFDGHCIWIIPVTVEDYPGVATRRVAGKSRDDAAKSLHRFLSVLSWKESCGISVSYQTGGGMPMMVGRAENDSFSIREAFDLTDIVCPEDEDARIALALVREGRGLNHYGYAFLSFWRVMELAYPDAKSRVAWMEKTLPSLIDHQARTALEKLELKKPQEVCRHLFGSGRCAVAHASSKPIVNPDDPADSWRLYQELPIVRGLAVRAIEDRFHILTSLTEYRNHLYELRGWKVVFNPDLVQRFVDGRGPRPDDEVDFPKVSVRLKDRPSYLPMEGMDVVSCEVDGGQVRLSFGSPEGLFRIGFILDFTEERLVFDVDRDLFLKDDGSVTASEYFRDLKRFIRDYFFNGELQIWNFEAKNLLSRKEAFMPMNVTLDIDQFNAGIIAAQDEVDARKKQNGV